MDEQEEDAYTSDVLKALESDNLPQFYVNSFTMNLGTGDVLMVMRRNHEQVGAIQMSYTVAKSLVVALGELIERLERRTGHEIMTSKFILKKMLEDTDDEIEDAG